MEVHRRVVHRDGHRVEVHRRVVHRDGHRVEVHRRVVHQDGRRVEAHHRVEGQPGGGYHPNRDPRLVHAFGPFGAAFPFDRSRRRRSCPASSRLPGRC